MNLVQHLKAMRVEVTGAIVESLTEQLETCHQCLSARFGEDVPGSWTYGAVYERSGVYEARAWQQSGSGPADKMGPGNLLVRVLIQDLRDVAVHVEKSNVGMWERTFEPTPDTTMIAGWLVDQWEALVCDARGCQPLPTNRRCFE